jgi:hypothetical protein
MKNKPSLVIFRRFPAGDVVALFPLEPATVSGWECSSYQAIGQHSAASPDLTRWTKAAKPSEYAPLKRELESIGYTLKVGTRVPRNAYETRKKAIKR